MREIDNPILGLNHHPKNSLTPQQHEAEFKDETGAGMQDGTQLVERNGLADVYYGMLRLLRFAGISPNNGPESRGNWGGSSLPHPSQIVEAMRRMFLIQYNAAGLPSNGNARVFDDFLGQLNRQLRWIFGRDLPSDLQGNISVDSNTALRNQLDGVTNQLSGNNGIWQILNNVVRNDEARYSGSAVMGEFPNSNQALRNALTIAENRIIALENSLNAISVPQTIYSVTRLMKRTSPTNTLFYSIQVVPAGSNIPPHGRYQLIVDAAYFSGEAGAGIYTGRNTSFRFSYSGNRVDLVQSGTYSGFLSQGGTLEITPTVISNINDTRFDDMPMSITLIRLGDS